MLASVTWDGGGGTYDWNHANNWDSNVLPSAGDEVVIGDLTGTPIITVSATTSVQRVTASERIAVTTDATLTTSQASTFSAGVDLVGGTFLPGNGSNIGNVVNNGGTIRNNGGPGTLYITGEFQQNSSSELQIALGGATAGISYDQLNVVGKVSVGGSLRLRVVDGYVGHQAFTIVNNDGNDPVVGTFDALPEGATISVGGSTLQISYLGGDGNDVVLTADDVDVFAVTSLDDDLAGSLRQAILSANISSGLDAILFDIPGPGPHTIEPLSPLPAITSPIFIDGWSQHGYLQTPAIELDGSSAGAGVDGLKLAANSAGSTVRGLAINRFAGDGIEVASDANRIVGNFIGTDVDGSLDLGNEQHGIYVISAAANTIGGTSTTDRNIVSGNTGDGIHIVGTASTLNAISGNYLGVDVSGSVAIGNSGSGIHITGGAGQNIVGGSASGAGNVIAGHSNTASYTGYGLFIDGAATANVVAGNLVGLDSTGSAAIANRIGVYLRSGAAENRIGSDGDTLGDTNERNVISGNSLVNVAIEGASSNVVAGNFLGSSATGAATFRPSSGNVFISGAAQSNVIGYTGVGDIEAQRNYIVGLGVVIQDLGTQFNRVAGNHIGVNVFGSASTSGMAGITIQVQASDNIVGTNSDALGDAFEGNLISGFSGQQRSAVRMTGSGVDRNVIAGNLIGTDELGAVAIGNQIGVLIDQSAKLNRIGSDADGISDSWEGNVISASASHGVHLDGSGTNQNTIAGNKIGTDISGLSVLANGTAGIMISGGASNNTIGGDAGPAGNLISGNGVFGIALRGNESDNNTILGNWIGLDATGNAALGNYHGIDVIDADNTIIGGTTTAARNVISAANVGDGGGIRILSGADNAVIIGNSVGSNAAGDATVGNQKFGIMVQGNPLNTRIGGASAGDGNTIVGTADNVGIQLYGGVSPVIQANRIGTTASGTVLVGALRAGIDSNSYGGTADDITIGGSSTWVNGMLTGAGNVIAGSYVGIGVAHQTGVTTISGNVIGTDLTGTFDFGNDVGIRIGGTNVVIGGATEDRRNVISGNRNGVYLDDADGALLEGNYIGTDRTGSQVLGNSADGVQISGQSNPTTGAIVRGNLVSGNGGTGINLFGVGVTSNRIEGNLIGTDATGTVDLGNAGDGVGLQSVSNNTIGGTTVALRNIISGNNGSGVQLVSASVNNTIIGNLIGTNISGQAALANSGYGVGISGGSSSNTIGGNDSLQRNVISGNLNDGIRIFGIGTNDNLVSGNFIGTNVAGSAAIGNRGGGGGVFVYDGPANTQIGGIAVGAGNLISGNSGSSGDGIEIEAASGTMIFGNLIGLDATGMFALGNSQAGVFLDRATGTQLGGPTPAHRNIISGNTATYAAGVWMNLATASANRVQGNYIGTNITGLAAVPNAGPGVKLSGGAKANIIGTDSDGIDDATEGNLISGNQAQGVLITDSGSDNNRVAGNYIGTNASGTAALRNTSDGVWVTSANNVIGGSSLHAGNLVSGNGWNGINIQYATALGNKVQGNRVGLDASGTAAIANANHGVLVWGGARDTVIGVDGDGQSDFGEGNVIAGNTWDGVSFWSGGAFNTVIAGNRIGTTADGLSRLSHARYGVWITQGTFQTRIGTNADGISDELERNLVSGGGSDGVRIDVPGDTQTVIAGNYIGTDIHGAATFQNTLALYKGNATAADHVGGNVTGTLLNGTNYAGGFVGQAFDFDGDDDAIALATNTLNAAYGTLTIEAWVFPRSHGTDVSGLLGKTVISRSDGDGFALRLHNGSIQADLRLSTGNHLPTFSSQAVPLNQWSHVAYSYDGANIRAYLNGVLLGTSSASGTIRTSANASTVTMIGNQPQETVVQPGNYGFHGMIDELGVYQRALTVSELKQIVSFQSAGRPQGKDLGNRGQGVIVFNGSSGTRIGSDGNGINDLAERNVIARSGSNGVYILGALSDRNVIAGNYIGTDASGTLAQGNLASGVYVHNGPLQTKIGVANAGNLISANGWSGVDIVGWGTNHTSVAANRIGTDASGNQDLGNVNHGVVVIGQAKDTIVGTNDDGISDFAEGNVISGNDGWSGVVVSGSGTDRTILAGNYVGLNAAGNAAIGNNGTSIAVISGAVATRIGTDGDGLSDAAERNVLSGNVWEVLVEGLGTDHTIIAGNYIGTNAAGNAAIPNSLGITVRFGPKHTRIGTDGSNDAFNVSERNVISGNATGGIRVTTPNWNAEMPAGGATTDSTVIAGNYIGLNAAGTAPIANLGSGIFATQMPTDLRIGTDGDGVADEWERNVISGNSGHGVQVDGWSYMSVPTAEHIISGVVPRTSVTSSIAQADLRDVTGGAGVGNWTFNHPIPGGGGDNYAFRATGVLQVVTAGSFSFALGSDDGGRLRINGIDVVVDNANHAFLSRYGSITLPVGAHTFEWIGYEGSGAAAFEVAVAIGAGVTSSVTAANGWRVLGAADPHPQIALLGSISVTAYYPSPPSLGLKIAGNFIGTDPSGAQDFGNNGDGIRVQARAKGVAIGGATPAMRNVISGNNNDGIEIFGNGSTDIVIAGNYIGTNAAGNADLGNTVVGVRVISAAGNTIGGGNVALRNLISGNDQQGVFVSGVGADNNVIAGNYIGTDISGEFAVGNGTTAVLVASMGIFIGNGAQNNRVGTDGDGINDAGERNLLSGNLSDGIKIQTNSSYNVIAGNYIGTNQDGTRALGNGRSGVFIQSTGLNRVGTDSNGVGDSAERNLIAANASHGVLFSTAGANGNLVAGNYIGTDVTGTLSLGNRLDGVALQDGSVATVIGGTAATARNIISGNHGSGLRISGATSAANVVIGNFIGLTPLGTAALGNSLHGVFINTGSKNNRIGTDGDGVEDLQERNVISGNVAGSDANVTISDPGTINNIVAGNYIGTTADGASGVVNAGSGIRIAAGASLNRIGTDGSNDAFNVNERNVISGHAGAAVSVTGDATDNSIAGNFIGLNSAGTAGIANADGGIHLDSSSGTRIGTNSDGIADGEEANVIAGSGNFGVSIGNYSTYNVVAGNRIGTNAAGTAAIANATAGISLWGGSSYNLIGGIAPNSGNLISGNAGAGIWLMRTFAGMVVEPSPENFIQGNRIGTDVSGTLDLGNTGDGIRIEELETTIGGNTSEARNLISGNDDAGIRISGSEAVGNLIQGNFVGTDVAGEVALGNNTDGIRIEDSSGNEVGGTEATQRNLISGNLAAGIHVSGATSTGNVVLGNYIGTNLAGDSALPNATGVIVAGQDNLIGGGFAEARNLISGNSGSGVYVIGEGTGNKVQGNYIGTDSTGTIAVGNASAAGVAAAGVLVASSGGNGVLIGTDSDGYDDADEGNVISGNFRFGVRLQGGYDDLGSHVVAGNRIGVDASGTAAVPNQGGGIHILNSRNNQIGTNADDSFDSLEANIISGNRNFGGNPEGSLPAPGILISDSDRNDLLFASHNTIAGNAIGVDGSRSFALGNQASGILIADAWDNTIGGNGLVSANVVAYNAVGVSVVGASRGNSIRRNSLFNNVGLGIDLGADGVTVNDSIDADDGANSLQNYPLLSAPTSGAQTRVVGQIESLPLEFFEIDFYASSIVDPSGFGEGKRYLGTLSVTTNLSGIANFDESLPGVSVDGDRITAIAIDSSGNASEFSAAVIANAASEAAPTVDSSNLILTAALGDNAFGVPSQVFTEGSIVRLDGLFANLDATDAHTVQIDWGDGSPLTTLAVAPGPRGFAVSHLYADDRPTGTPQDTYTIEIFVTDDDNSSGRAAIGVTIVNAVAAFDALPTLSSLQAFEGDSLVLTGQFTDAGEDLHRLRINWGDGSPLQTVPLESLTRSFAVPHRFINESSQVSMTLLDDDTIEPSTAHSVTLFVDVRNAAPAPVFNGVANSQEGMPLTLIASANDPGVSDSVTFEWIVTRDGMQIFQASGPTLNYTPPDQGVYGFALIATDPLGASGSLVQMTSVANVAPTLNPASLAVTAIGGATLQAIVAEGAAFELRGSYIDPGLGDAHSITVQWGDGSPVTTLELEPGQISFVASHRYLDDGIRGTSSDSYPISVNVSDGIADHAISTAITVQNVAPTVAIFDNGSDDLTIRLRTVVMDDSLLDTFTYAWNVVGITLPTDTIRDRSTIEFLRSASDFAEVGVTVNDDDGGTATAVAVIVLGSSRADTITLSGGALGEVTVEVTSEGTTSSADVAPSGVILVVAQDGDDSVIVDPSVTVATIIDAGGGNDTVAAGSGADTISGGLGDDFIDAGDGNNVIDISEGDDTSTSGTGDDVIRIHGFSDKTINDSGGSDILDFSGVYASATIHEGVRLDLTLVGGQRQDVRSDGSLALAGTFEGIIGSRFNDKFIGNGANNYLAGMEGEDLLFGGDGSDDTLDGGSGNDSIVGSTGNDLIFGGDGEDTIQSGTGEQSISAGSGNDLIFGGGGLDDTLDGGSGDDSIRGSNGNDLIFGGDGDDTIQSGNGEQSISGGNGNDLIFGGDNGDATMDGGSGDDSIRSGGGNDLIFGGDGEDTLQSGSGEQTLAGGAGNDLIFGSTGKDPVAGEVSIPGSIGDDLIFGGDGDDTIVGGSGNETLSGGSGNDLIFGGPGDDTLLGSADDSIRGSDGNDLIFGADGDDTIVGGNGDQSIDGGAGNDLIFGSDESDDTLTGGLGDDSIVASTGNDLIFGGSGDDTITSGQGDQTIAGGNGNDLIFAGDGGHDTIVSGSGGQSISGGAGDDLIFGGNSSGSDDTLDGGSGDDSIVAGTSNDLIFGGDGDDTIQAGSGDQSVSGGSGNDLIFGGSGGDDTLDGGGGDDSIVGSAGNDLIFGGDGDDTIAAGSGDESISGGLGNDLIFGGAGGDDTLDGGSGEDSIIASTGNDLIFGGDGNDTLAGGSGEQTLVGGSGNDLIFGGEHGSDTLLASSGDQSLSGGAGNDLIFGGDGGDDTLDGGSGDDSIVGSSGNDLIFGGDGDDTLRAGSGDQSIAAGDGNDLIFGGDGGDDTLAGGGGDDSIVGSSGNDLIFGGDGDDTVEAGSGDASLDGGIGNDLIFGGSGDDTIDGSGGDDSIVGSQGNDLIFGGAGDDTYTAGSGDDSLSGGEGNDLIFAAISSHATFTATQLVNEGHGGITFVGFEAATLHGNELANRMDGSAAVIPLYLVGGGGDDSLVGGSKDDVLDGGSGNDWLRGGEGDDTYRFSPTSQGAVTIDEAESQGVDTLDFLSVAGGIVVDLAESSLQFATSTLSLSLLGNFENVFGTAFNDKIYGNAFDNQLSGAAGDDELFGRAGNDTLAAGVTRMVYLDFDSLTEQGEHVYTASQREEIQQRMEADYGLFDVKFSQTKPLRGSFITIAFNASVNLPGSRLSLGGISERIGWRELTGQGLVRVDVNGFLGSGLNKLPGTHQNFVALSSTIAAHELAHMYGLGHADSFGAPGTGIYSGRNLHNRFRPIYDGPLAATETRLHLLASPASVGTTLIDALGDPFFGEREAIKLAFAESGYVVAEARESEKVNASQSLGVLTQVLGELPMLSVPNTIVTGINHGKTLDVAAINVTGQIELTLAGISESDYYSFTGRAGDLVTLEVLSDTLRHRFPNTIDSLLRVYDSEGQKVAYYGSKLGAFNDDLFEPTDSLIIDLILPTDGTYTIEVDTFSFAAPEFPDYQPNFDLQSFRIANPNNVYVTDRDTGHYELFIYRVGGVLAPQVARGDTLVGGAGADVLIGHSGQETIVGFNFAEDRRFDSSGEPVLVGSPPTLTPVNVPPAQEGTAVTFTAVGNDVAGATLTYRLENVPGMSFPAGATIDHLTGEFYFLPKNDGVYAVRVIVDDAAGEMAFEDVTFTVANAAPIANAGGNRTVTEGTPIVLVGSYTDLGSADTHRVAWQISNSSGDVVAIGDGVSISFTFTNEGIYTALLTVTDNSSDSTTNVAMIDVVNAVPVVDAGFDHTGVEGTPITLAGAFVDAGIFDTHSIVWTIKGPHDEVIASDNGLSITFVPPNDGVYTASLTVIDDEGASATDVALITVDNALPVITSVVLAQGTTIDRVELSGVFTDAGIADRHLASIDWGDGQTEAIVVVPSPTGGLLMAGHTYTASGIYTTTLTITDDGGDVAVHSTLVQVSAIGVVNGELRIIGTTQDDTIRVYQLLGIYAVYASFLPGTGIQFFEASQIDRLYIAGSDGNDSIDVSLIVTDTTVILGGAGNDTLRGGYGNDSLDGGTGDDTIEGRTGNDSIFGGTGIDRIDAGDGNDIVRGGDGDDEIDGGSGDDILIGDGGNDILEGGHGGDVMIGGLGADLLAGEQGEDVLIAGYTTFDHNNEALMGIMNEWNSTRPLATRIKNIRGTGSATALNGTAFLKADQTVIGDATRDRLEGDAGKDWFFASLADDIEDTNPNEVLDLLSS